MYRPVDTPASRAVARPMRLVRSLAAALVCTVTAALGHLAGGGVIPSGVAALVFVGAAVMAWLLAGRRVTAGQLVGLLVLCQVCVHFGSTSMDMSATMLATHLLATVGSAVLLTRGEAFVWQIAERLVLRALPALRRVRPVAIMRPHAPAHRDLVLTSLLLAHSRAERGPPIAS